MGGDDTSTIVCVGRHVGIFDELSQKQKKMALKIKKREKIRYPVG